MRLFFACILLGSTCQLYAQEHVSSAILAFHAGAFERCIDDLNKALKNPASLTVPARAKAYYYRGMAKIKFRNPATATHDYRIGVLDDLQKAKSLDAQYNERANEEIQRIASQIVQQAQLDYEKAIGTFDPDVSRPLLSVANDRLTDYLDIVKNPSAKLLLAKVCEAHGNVYYNMAEVGDPMEVQRQFLAHYSQAIDHYEELLNWQDGTKEIFTSLKVLSGRVEDRDRESRYAYLVEKIGG